MDDNHQQRPLPRLDATVSAHQRRESRPRRRPCVRWGCIALATLVFLILVGLVLVRVMVAGRLTLEERQQIHAMETEVVQLPPHWHRPAELPPSEVLEARKKLNESVKEIRAKHEDMLFGDYSRDNDLLAMLRRGEPVPAERQAGFDSFLQDVQRLIDEVTRAVALPGYTFEGGTLDNDVSQFLPAQVIAKYTSIVALHQAQQGNCTDAIETAMLPIRLISRPDYSLAITHLISVAVLGIATQTIYAISEQCDGLEALRHGLKLLTELHDTAYPGDTSHWRYGDTVGLLLFAAANGYPANLEPQPLLSYYTQASPILGGHYHEWIIENLPPDDPRVASARTYLKSDAFKIYKDTVKLNAGSGFQTAVARRVLGFDLFAHTISSLTRSNYLETEARTSVTLASYDLTRIHLAERLVASNPAATTVTAYLSPVPNDPFTGAPFLYNAREKKPYSVGPDKTDDKAAIIYDATNGTFSSGDVWMNIR